MDRTSGQPHVKLSLKRSIYLKIRPLDREKVEGIGCHLHTSISLLNTMTTFPEAFVHPRNPYIFSPYFLLSLIYIVRLPFRPSNVFESLFSAGKLSEYLQIETIVFTPHCK
jgi:hypothetical protein